MRQCRQGVAGDISDVSDMHFDTIGTEMKKYCWNTYKKQSILDLCIFLQGNMEYTQAFYLTYNILPIPYDSLN